MACREKPFAAQSKLPWVTRSLTESSTFFRRLPCRRRASNMLPRAGCSAALRDRSPALYGVSCLRATSRRRRRRHKGYCWWRMPISVALGSGRESRGAERCRATGEGRAETCEQRRSAFLLFGTGDARVLKGRGAVYGPALTRRSAEIFGHVCVVSASRRARILFLGDADEGTAVKAGATFKYRKSVLHFKRHWRTGQFSIF